MMPREFLALFVVFLVVLIAVAAYSAYLRRKQWREMAERFGMTAHEGDPFDIKHTEPGFRLLDRGHSQRVLRVLSGTWRGVPVRVFDYRYKTGSGKHESSHTLTALMAELPMACDRVQIRPEGLGDWIASAFGFDDIDFEYEEFNRRFHVTAGSKRFAYDICHPGMMEFLMGAPEFCWELLDHSLLLYSEHRRSLDAEQVRRSLDLAADFIGLIPDYLRSR